MFNAASIGFHGSSSGGNWFRIRSAVNVYLLSWLAIVDFRAFFDAWINITKVDLTGLVKMIEHAGWLGFHLDLFVPIDYRASMTLSFLKGV